MYQMKIRIQQLFLMLYWKKDIITPSFEQPAETTDACESVLRTNVFKRHLYARKTSPREPQPAALHGSPNIIHVHL